MSSGHDGAMDPETDDFLKTWEHLTQHEWVDLYNCLIEGTAETSEAVLALIIQILQTVYNTVKIKYKNQLEDMCFQVKFPGEETNTRDCKLTEQDIKEISKLCQACQSKTLPYCIESIQHAIADEKSIKMFYERESSCRHQRNKCLDKFILRAVELTWLAALEDPQPVFVTNPKKECPEILDAFEGFQKLRKGYVVEIPAVIQGRTLLSHWKLHDLKQGRQLKHRAAENGSDAVDGGSFISHSNSTAVHASETKPLNEQKTRPDSKEKADGSKERRAQQPENEQNNASRMHVSAKNSNQTHSQRNTKTQNISHHQRTGKLAKEVHKNTQF